MAVTVGVEELKVGMFVHLDLGWWAHPFALSSFLVSSPDQLDTIRGLGLKKLRWSPEKSRLDEVASPPVARAPTSPAAAQDGADAVERAQAPDETPSQGVNGHIGQAADQAAHGAGAEAHVAPPEPARVVSGPVARQRAVLADQRSAQRLCEQQYAEAGASWLEAQRQVVKAPEMARHIAEGTTRALLDKMMVDREMCVRVLADVGGDRVTGHALNVTVISLLMARVFGFNEAAMQDVGVGALLHDVGKLDLAERVQHADGQLNPTDTLAYRDHVACGVAHGRRMGLTDGALSVLAQHHEMADGSGFPAGLGGDRISTAARIVALVNCYDKLCNPLQSAAALTPHEALSLIFAQARTKFDATMLNAFIRMMGVYPPGSVVQLTDDRFACVVSVNSSRPLKPRVLVCDTRVPLADALLLNLDTQPDLGIRRSLKPAQLPGAARDYLSPQPRMVYFFEPVIAAPGESVAAGAA